LNPIVKTVAELALTASGIEKMARRRLRESTLVLAYHDIVPDADRPIGERSLHLSRRDFARQLDHVARTCDVAPIDTLLEAKRATGRPRVIVTFDDAYAGALTAGVDELVRRGMPATIFVAPGLLGTTTWWDVLGEAFGGEIPAVVRQRALGEYRGDARAVVEAESGGGKPLTRKALARIGTEAELQRAAAQPGISIGSHSWSHRNLCAVDRPDLDQELKTSLEWLRVRFTRTVKWLSYPYGLYNAELDRLAKDTGYVGTLRIEGGWIRKSPPTPLALPRLNIPAGLSIRGFRLRLAGL
jgi:peptidoglycan/xylan/chitin deacetylase (PgdA/CDA1 family)